MSSAYECDACGKLYQATTFGTFRLDVKHNLADESQDTWSDIDLCRACSAKLLDVIKPALGGFRKPE